MHESQIYIKKTFKTLNTEKIGEVGCRLSLPSLGGCQNITTANPCDQMRNTIEGTCYK